MEKHIYILNSICEAQNRLQRHLIKETSTHHSNENEYDVSVFSQSWSSTACGWGGFAGQAFTNADTVVVMFPQYDIAFIYINRFAYSCKMDSDFYKCLNAKNFPGFYNLTNTGNTKLQIIELANSSNK